MFVSGKRRSPSCSQARDEVLKPAKIRFSHQFSGLLCSWSLGSRFSLSVSACGERCVSCPASHTNMLLQTEATEVQRRPRVNQSQDFEILSFTFSTCSQGGWLPRHDEGNSRGWREGHAHRMVICCFALSKVSIHCCRCDLTRLSCQKRT